MKEEQEEEEQQDEEFDLKSFRAKLEQNTSQIVVNLDDHFKQQRIKKLLDLKKKTEAANFLQSYKNADLTVSKQFLSPVSAAMGKGFAFQRKEGRIAPSRTDNVNVQQTTQRSESCSDDGDHADVSYNACIEVGIDDKGLEEEELHDGNVDETKNFLKKMEEAKEHNLIDDISVIPSYKHLLVTPERNYLKVFFSCWCGD